MKKAFLIPGTRPEQLSRRRPAAATERPQLRQLSERLREMAKWHLEGFADHITLMEAADALSTPHDTHGAKRVSAPDMVQTSPDEENGRTETQRSAGDARDLCADCGLDWCGVTCGRWPKGAVDAQS